MREFSMTIVTAWHGRRQQAGNMGFGGRPCKYAWNCMISSRKRKNLPPMGGPSYSLPILLWFSSLGFCPLPSFQTQLTALQLVTAKKTWTIIACALLLHPPPPPPRRVFDDHHDRDKNFPWIWVETFFCAHCTPPPHPTKGVFDNRQRKKFRTLIWPRIITPFEKSWARLWHVEYEQFFRPPPHVSFQCLMTCDQEKFLALNLISMRMNTPFKMLGLCLLNKILLLEQIEQNQTKQIQT